MGKKDKQRRERERVSARKHVDESGGDFKLTTIEVPEGLKLFTVKETCTKRLNVIPYKVGEGNPHAAPGSLHYERTYHAHKNIGPDNDRQVCLRKTVGKPCPVCDYKAKISQKPSTDDDDIKALETQTRQLWLVQDLDEPDVLQLWDVARFTFWKKLRDLISNADDNEYDFFADPVDGLLLRIGFEEKSFSGRKYRDVVSIELKPRKKPIPDKLLEEAPCLDDMLIVHDYDKLRSIFLQTGDETKPDKKDKKKKGKGKKGKKKKSEIPF